ncbi:MAG: leucine--tRNA ligase [Deltaproteobacteria bacterium]|nr:leucine--tRNA ligase [Deltaproteobacteria bacterium]
MLKKYDFVSIEEKWQQHWRDNDTFRALDPGDADFDPKQKKFYVLDMFPYPSGAGLHVGHPLGYIATDIVARYKRMTGHNVLHPMGFDAFGLPAEQYAIEHGVHPRITTQNNVDNMRRQLKGLGLSYDWKREISTISADYYQWTQWIFLQLFGSYYCAREQRALPIETLVTHLESGKLVVDDELQIVDAAATEGCTTMPYAQLSSADKEAVIDHQRLAYLANVPVNWCPALGTVLANEEVTADGRSERGNHPVFKRPLKQWMLRITRYAERLLDDLDQVDWPEPIKLMQRNWVGRSEGAMVDFALDDTKHSETPIRVYTTRPDTLFGATYMVLAPEHELVDMLTTPEQKDAIETYRRQAATKSEIDRQADVKIKSGVFTGAYARNPVNGQKVPIWIADYVLMGYGTGAIMAVPGHDQRDFEFALQFELPMIPVVMPDDAWLEEQAHAAGRPDAKGDKEKLHADYLANTREYGVAFSGEGVGVNSNNDEVSFDGKTTPEAKEVITTWLVKKRLGRFQVQYKLRDWLFSRQRYWGEPFPVLHAEDGTLRAVDNNELPVELPPMDDFSPPTSDDPAIPPKPSLSRATEDWRVVNIEGERYERELNTMPQWAGSCWYYLRFIDPRNSERMVDAEKERYWMGETGVDLYVGGAEHAVLHLLYARFWHKVLFDLGHVSTREPFGRLFNQGYILAYAYTDERGAYIPAEEVVEKEPGLFCHQDKPVERSFGKMGKSLKNAVTPDTMFTEYGCDTLRLYEMYMGPLEVSKPWNTRDIVGVHRFLRRIWRNFYQEEGEALLVSEGPADKDTKRLLHKTIKRVTDDLERMRFNTALAAMIELNNALVSLETLPREVAETLVLMLAPFAPHISEELWQAMGHQQSLSCEPWPSYDEALLVDDQIEIVVQVKGKTRGRVHVAPDADQETIHAAAMADAKIAKHIEGKSIKKVIYVPGRLLNIVAV